MKEKIQRIFDVTIKSIDEDNGIVSARVSSNSVDRYKEVINPAAFKKHIKTYKKHPVLLTSHNYHSLLNQIGEGIPATLDFDDTKMDIDFKYYIGEGNEEADWGFFLAKQGKAAYSIGFIGHKWDEGSIEDDGYYYKLAEGELLEISQVLIPANPDALQKMFDDGQLEEKEYNELSELLKAFKKECDEFKLEFKKPKKTGVRGIEPVNKVDCFKIKEMTEEDIKGMLRDIITEMSEIDTGLSNKINSFSEEMKKINKLQEINKESIKDMIKECIKEMVVEVNNPKDFYETLLRDGKLMPAPKTENEFGSKDVDNIKQLFPEGKKE